jgi:acetyltransferase-like isoleucine patch superfamily enzyme
MILIRPYRAFKRRIEVALWTIMRWIDPSFGIKRGRNCRISRKARFEGKLENIELGDNVTIREFAFLQCGNRKGHIRVRDNSYIGVFTQLITAKTGAIEVGANCSIQDFSMVLGNGGIKIGDDTRIAAHTLLLSADHAFDDEHSLLRLQGRKAAPIEIAHNVWIAAGVRITSGVTIGTGSVVATGAVVTKSFADNSLIAGVPARLLRNRVTEIGGQGAAVQPLRTE